MDHTPQTPPARRLNHSHDWGVGEGSGGVNLLNLDPPLCTSQGGFTHQFMASAGPDEAKWGSFPTLWNSLLAGICHLLKLKPDLNTDLFSLNFTHV